MAKNNEKPLTLDGLVKYNQEVLFPYLHKSFVVKKDFNNFKNKSLTNQDEILKRLGALLQEKTVGDGQDKKEKKILSIHNEVLKEHNILSSKNIEEITKLEFF